MAIALDATSSGDSANSYVTATEADDYFAAHFSEAKTSVWSGLEAHRKVTLLRLACSIIETLPFHGGTVGPAVWDQALQFPTTEDYADNAYAVPQVVKDAQCEQAIYLLTADEASMTAQMQGIWEESLQAGDVKVGTVYSGGGVTASMVAPLSFQLLRPYVRKGSSRVARA